MKNVKIFGLFFAILFLTSIFVGCVLICINNFIDLLDMKWFWIGLTISIISSIVGTVLIVYNTKRIRETKISFWIEKNYPKLLLGYFLFVLALASVRNQPVWNTDMVYEVLSLQWTIFGLSLTIFLVWNVIIVEYLKGKQPKESDSSSLLSKYTIAIEKRTYSQEIETTFITAIILTINLFLLLLSTSAIYISSKPDSIITQNILLCSFFFTTNSIGCLFLDILKPLNKDKTDLLRNNNVTKEDIDKAQADLIAQAIIDGIKANIMSLDSEKYPEDEKKKMLVECLEALRDYLQSKEDSNSANQKE